MYCTHTPCIICAKMIANSGIEEVISCQDYPDADAKRLLMESNILLKTMNKPTFYITVRE